jgi:formate hydrogenlyase subunit 4
MNVGEWLLSLGQGLICILVAPLAIGMLRWAKARLQGRQGPHLIQPYLDLGKLLGKRPVVPETASWVFRAAPYVVFTCYALLGFLVPIVYLPQGSTPSWADLLVLVYLLGLAKFTMALAGMDTGAPLAGLGSSRKMFVQVLVEPTLVVSVYALALRWRTTSLPAIVYHNWQARPGAVFTDPTLLLAGLALVIIVLAEAGRIPFDNPATHLELTMFGKAIHLEYAGPHLALIEWSEALRLSFFLTLLSNMFAPWLLAANGLNPALNSMLILAYPIKLLALALILGAWEATRAKLRLRAVSGPAASALVFALLSAVVAVITYYLL